MEDRMTVTSEMIEQGRSRNGDWSDVQRALVGVYGPPDEGWHVKVVGKTITAEKARRFVELKDAHVPGGRGFGTAKVKLTSGEKKAKQKQQRTRARERNGRDYESRNLILKEMGFASYGAYLASDLWKSVRAKVFAVKGRKCFLCGAFATEAHHNRYHRNELTGRKLKYINPICHRCHEGIEFEGDRKLSLAGARQAYGQARQEHTNGKK